MKRTLACILFLIALGLHAQDTSVVFRLYLVGDAGEHAKPGKALRLLGQELDGRDSAAVVLLGDNAYPRGFNPKAYSHYPFRDTAAAARLFAQLRQLKNFHGSAYVVPGNHDWLAQKRKGAWALAREESETKVFLADSCPYLENPRDERFLPSGQQHGPVAVEPFAGFRLVALDTQWPLQGCIKGGGGCMTAGKRKRAVKQMAHNLDSLLTDAAAKKEQVIIVAHHPLYTNGEHSGHLKLLHALIDYTPMKIFGWLGVDRLLSQDMIHPRYKRMRKALLPVIEKHGNVIYASGHDHNLQYFDDKKSNRYIVSGAGSKKSKLRKKQKFPSKYQQDKLTGFFCVEFLKNGQKRIVVYTGDGAKAVLETY